MMQFDNYTITKISSEDALGIHQLMIANADRFKKYFPKTLEANQLLPLAEQFAVQKEKEFNAKEEFLFVIKNKENVIGLIYVKELDWNKKQGELAYCIAKEESKKGLMTKVVEFVSQYAFTTFQLNILQIIVHKDNIASVKVATNNNYMWQKTLLNEYTPPNESPLDMELYELYNER